MNDHLHSFLTRSYQLNITPYISARYPRFRVRSDRGRARRNIKRRGELYSRRKNKEERTREERKGRRKRGENKERPSGQDATEWNEEKKQDGEERRGERASIIKRGEKETALEALDGNHVRSGRDGRARGDEKRTLALRSFMKRRRRTAPERIVTGTRTIATSANAVANVNYHRENRAGLAYFKRPPLRSPVFFLREGQ